MRKYKTYKELIEHKLMVVVRGNTPEEAIKTAEACMEGGVKSLEVTFTIPNAEQVISYLRSREKVLVGAGSVLDAETAKLAIHAGASFVVGPNFNPQVALLCNRYQIPYIPGCMTINEMVKAMEAGVSIVKLFPGQVFTPSHIKAVKGPLPQVEIMPTGGVNLENVQEWLEYGAVLVGVGGKITCTANHGDFAGVTAHSRAFMEAVK